MVVLGLKCSLSITDGRDATSSFWGELTTGPLDREQVVHGLCGFPEANRCSAAAFLSAGFVRSWKTWKSHGILKWSFPGLEKSWQKLKS